MRIGQPVGKTKTPIKRLGNRRKLEDLDIEFPEDEEPSIQSLSQAKILFHGETKIGKTLTALQFPQTYLLMCEPGGSGVTTRKKTITSWKQYRAIIEGLKDVPLEKCKTVITDTVDFAHDYCFRETCIKEGVDHPSEKGYGKVWDAIKAEFIEVMDMLTKQKRGIIFISHTESKPFQERFGGSYDKLVPTMANRAREYVGAIVDLTAYFGYYSGKRFMTIEGSENLDAGHRLEERFWVKGKEGSVRVHSIPMGLNAKTAYDNLVKAFNNQQLRSGEPEVNPFLSETRKKFVKK